MTASAWIALASLAGFLFLQTAAFAFFMGGMAQKVKSLEDRPHDGDCKVELAALTGRFEDLKGLVSELSRDIKNLLSSKAPARRSGG